MDKEVQKSITCPICHMTSYNVNDIEHGYCGNCHDFTRDLPPVPLPAVQVEDEDDEEKEDPIAEVLKFGCDHSKYRYKIVGPHRGRACTNCGQEY